jgi:hypothetical protein
MIYTGARPHATIRSQVSLSYMTELRQRAPTHRDLRDDLEWRAPHRLIVLSRDRAGVATAIGC